MPSLNFEKTAINLFDQLRKECKTGNLVYCVLQWKPESFFLFCDFCSMFRRELSIVFNPMCFLGFLGVAVFCLMFVLINLKISCSIWPWIVV